MFEFKEMMSGDDRVYAVVCKEHAGLDPVCEIELSMRKVAQARKGTRPKIVREAYVRASCKLCERSVCRKFENVVGLLEE